MKKMSKKSVLLGLVLLGTVALVGFVSALVINIDDSIELHKVRLHSLYLGSGDEESDYAKVYMDIDESVLRIGSGLMIGGLDVGVAGGSGNGIYDDNSDFMKVIGGGERNGVIGEMGVVVGGYANEANAGGAIVGGYGNNAVDSTVVGGFNNYAENYSLVFGSGAQAYNYSFSWNTNMLTSGFPSSSSASISAKSGVLIGTYTPITGVNLVVSGVVKFGGEEINEGDLGYIGEIRAVSGCFYAYDGTSWRIINEGDISNCGDVGIEGTCKFGNIRMLNGQTLTGYKQPYAESCVEKQVTCSESKLYLDSIEGVYYPYCYEYS